MSSQERLPTASSSRWQPLSAEMAQDQMSSRRPSSIQVQVFEEEVSRLVMCYHYHALQTTLTFIIL